MERIKTFEKEPPKVRFRPTQDFYYKHENRWVKFTLKTEDTQKWYCFCRQVQATITRGDFERFVKQYEIEVVKDYGKKEQ